MKGISKTEIKLISKLEFEKKQFFTTEDIEEVARDKTQRYNIIKNLLKKDRIEKLNKTKYYLIPIKAQYSSWAEWSFIVADEAMNGKDYCIGGWAAAHYWGLTEQVPAKIEVYSTKRQGQQTIVNTPLIFRRTTRKRLKKTTTRTIKGHTFKILNKEETKRWLSKR